MQQNQRQPMGLMQATSLVTGNLVGTGAFLLPATLASFGALSLMGWLLTALGAIFLSLVFSKLSSQLPRTGGPHVFVGEAFGKEASFYTAWGYWVLSWVSNCAVVVAAVSYLSPICGGLSTLSTLVIELGIIVVITAINLRGIELAGRLELLITVLKLLPLLVIPCVGLFFIQADNFLPFNPTEQSVPSALMAVLFITIWGFIGLETATVPSGEIKNPNKTIPRATILGTLIAAVVYILGTVVILGVVPKGDLLSSSAPYADLAQVLFGGHWGVPIAIAAIVCSIGTFHGWTMVVGRIAQGAANDGLFPEFFKAKTNGGAPKWGLIVSSMCTAPLLVLTLQEGLVEQFNFIIELSVTLILVVYLACIFSYIKIFCLNRFSSVTTYMVAIGALAFTLVALWAAGLTMVLMSLSIILVGVPIRAYLNRTPNEQQVLQS